MDEQRAHLPFLDTLRGFAILGVFLFHSLGISFGYDQLPWVHGIRDYSQSKSFLLLYPLSYGTGGVAVFFVVSGFCIHLSHIRSASKSWGNFVGKRFFRIYPPYLFAVILFYFGWPFLIGQDPHNETSWQLISHLVSIQNLDSKVVFGINPSFWSIAIEIQLYAIYPLLLAISIKHGWTRALALTALIEICIRTASTISINFFDSPIPQYIFGSPFTFWFSWSTGAYLADCWLIGKQSMLQKVPFSLCLLLTMFSSQFRLSEQFGFTAFALTTAVAIDRLMSGAWTMPKKHLWCFPHLNSLGCISFSFYLLHQPILFLAPGFLKQLYPNTYMHPLAVLGACLAFYPMVFLFSKISYIYIERVSINLGSRLLKSIKLRQLLRQAECKHS